MNLNSDKVKRYAFKKREKYYNRSNIGCILVYVPNRKKVNDYTAEHGFVSSTKIPLFTKLRVAESIAVFRNIMARLVFEILTDENAKYDCFSQLACKFSNLYGNLFAQFVTEFKLHV